MKATNLATKPNRLEIYLSANMMLKIITMPNMGPANLFLIEFGRGLPPGATHKCHFVLIEFGRGLPPGATHKCQFLILFVLGLIN